MSHLASAPLRVARLAASMALAIAPAIAVAGTFPTPRADNPPQTDAAHTQRKTVTLGAVHVTDTRSSAVRAEARLVPGAVYTVSGARLRERAINNLGDALRYVPGVMADSNAGGDDLVLSIRGSNLNAISYDNAGVALYQDGLPVSAADGNNHNRMLDPGMASDIIVANGINALTYGASDLGGAIDVISRTARNSDPRQVSVSGGSHGQREAELSTGTASGAWDGMLTLDGKHFDGYRDHSAQNRESLYANGGWQVSDDLELRGYASYIDNRQQLPGSLTRAQFDADPRQADPAYAAGNHQLNVETARVAAKGTWNIDADSSLEFGLSSEYQRLFHPIVDVFVPAGPGPDAPMLDVFSLLINTAQRTSGGMARYHLHAGNHDLLAGINLAYTSNRGGNYGNDTGRRGPLQDLVDKHADSANLFVMDRWQFTPDWMLVYGAQGTTTRLVDRQVDGFDAGNRTPRGQTNRFSSLNPRVGLIRQLTPDSQLYASVGRLYQSPNTFDLDNARMERGPAATLDAMHGTSYELGVRGASDTTGPAPRWHWSVGSYYERIRDEIFSIDNPAAPGISLTANLPRTIHAGVEAEASATLPLAAGGYLEPRVSASWNAFSFDHDPVYGSNRLPSAPRYALHAELIYHTSNGFYVGPTLDTTGSRYADFANSYRVGGYTLVGLRGGLRRGRWELYAEADNLLDRRYAVSVGVLDRAGPDAAVLNPGAPRSIYLGARYRY